MNPELSLHLAAIFLNYFVKVGAAYLACWILNRLLRQPRYRFLLWKTFLLSSGTYWLWLIFYEYKRITASATDIGVASPLPSVPHSFSIPVGWSQGLVLVIQVFCVAYALAAILLVGMAAWRHLRLRVLLQRVIEPSDALHQLFLETCREIGISRAHLGVLPGLKSPATAGWWKPLILLPEVCEELGPTSQIADVMCHELIHVERRDYFWAAFTNFICYLLFFHPAIWKARKWMSFQGELACDLSVLESRPGNRADYADSLTYFVRLRMLQEGYSLGIDFAASESLGLRIQTILTAPTPMPWWKLVPRTTAGLALLVGFGLLVPVYSILLGFASSASDQTLVNTSLPTAIVHARKTSRARHLDPAQPQTTDISITPRTQSYIPETPSYTEVGGNGQHERARVVDEDRRAWSEAAPVGPAIQYPTASSIVRSTLGEIIASRASRGGRDHDRDDH
jgi:beta-lactamase regulating signal transducer with metallopeptidase domain